MDEHLWIVISDPAKDPARVLIVNLTSWQPDKDQSCALEPSDHPYIKHRTCVHYRESKLVAASHIQQFLASGVLRPHSPVSPELLAKLRRGALSSHYIRMAHAQVLIDQGLTE